VPKFPKQKVKEVNKKMNARDFRPVKDREEMKEEGERKKERQIQSVSAEDIAEEMKISLEERVTPYYLIPYEE
jgi:tRNA/tmRNA/rRNA uracil-C5-methylase (TrmA/RlmC/RlmD family)